MMKWDWQGDGYVKLRLSEDGKVVEYKYYYVD